MSQATNPNVIEETIDDEAFLAPGMPTQPNASQAGSQQQAPNQGAYQQQGQPNGFPYSNRADMVPQVRDIIKNISRSGILSEAGQSFVRQLQTTIEKFPAFDMEVITLSFPAESIAVCCGDLAVVLLMGECIQPTTDDLSPKVRHVVDACKSLAVLRPNSNMLLTMVVTEHDYHRVGQIASKIINCFMGRLEKSISQLTSDSFVKSVINISTRMIDFDTFRNACDPHGVPAHVTIPMVLSLGARQHINPQEVISVSEPNSAFAAMGGYVQFFLQPGTNVYLSAIRITEAMSVMDTPRILGLLLPKFAELALSSTVWSRQFRDFTRTDVNLGNLFLDEETGMPTVAKYDTEIDDYVNNRIAKPFLMYDFCEGRSHIPGSESLALSHLQRNMWAELNAFFEGRYIFPDQLTLSTFLSSEVVGVGQNGHVAEDSRAIGYLEVMGRKQIQSPCTELLTIARDPYASARVAHAHYAGTFVPLYLSNLVTINADALKMLSQAIAVSGIRFSAIDAESKIISTSMLSHIASQYGQLSLTPETSPVTSPVNVVYDSRGLFA